MTCSRLAALIGCLSLASLVLPGASQAASITVNFTATATTGPLSGDSYKGSFAYDNSGLTGVGSESTNPTAFSFNFFTSYSLADTTYIPIAFTNGTVNSLAFLVDNFNDVASGAPGFYISMNQGIPEFLYGFDFFGLSFPGPGGICPDALNACYSWEGSGNVKFGGSVTTVPEPAGPLPVFAYMSVLGGLLWMRRRRIAR